MSTDARNAPCPVIVMGTGGHAAVLIDALQQSGRVVLGCLDPNAAPGSHGPLDTAILGGDIALEQYPPHAVELVNGVGATDAATMPGGQLRSQLHRIWTERGYAFAAVIHPAATIASGCDLGEGVQIMAGAVVQTGTRIGDGGIINTGARIDHDCRIAASVHVAPGAVLCGAVTIDEGAFVGAGATIVPGVRIGAAARVAAGMTILGDVPPNARITPENSGFWRPQPQPQTASHATLGAVAMNPYSLSGNIKRDYRVFGA